jgi:DNA-binding CsgD family transcriptional regulator
VLVGRDLELGKIRRLVDGLRGGEGGVLMLRGEAGIGKTALLESASEMAGDATVLQACGIESESSLSFAALGDLVSPIVERRDSLPAPQEAALAAALAIGPPAPGPRLAVCAGALGVLEAAAADRPVLALIDDVQWLDEASRECVAYASRRARGPVALLLAGREGYPYGDLEGISSTAVRALDHVAAAELLGHSSPDLSDGVSDAVRLAAAGNPLALLEIPSTLTPPQRDGSAPLEEPLSPGQALEGVYAGRVSALPEATRTALLVAAASHSDDLGVVDAACRSVGSSADALQKAEAAKLVRLSATTVRFVHPLVRGAVYHSAQAAKRRAAHKALAEAVDGESRAWHLSAAALGPDADVAKALDGAAGIAAGRRAYAEAADALERAARLSVKSEHASRRLLAASAASLGAGRAEEAFALAREARRAASKPLTLAAAEHLGGVQALWRGQPEESLRLLERSAERALELNPTMAALSLADASFACLALGDARRSLALAERAFALLDDDTDDQVRAPVVAVLSWCLTLRGEGKRARPLMREAVRLTASVDPFSPTIHTMLIALNWQLPDEDYEGTITAALAFADGVREVGTLSGLATPLAVAGEAMYRLGRWDGLEGLCNESIAHAEKAYRWAPVARAMTIRSRLAAAQGREAESRADALAVLEFAAATGAGILQLYGHGALGFCELSARNVEAAIAELEVTEREAEEYGLEEPTVFPWAPDLIEAYVRADRDEPARRLLAKLTRQAKGADSAGAAAMAARCRGLVAPQDSFDQHFAQSLEHDALATMPFERARTILCWGMRLHRARRRTDARDRLRAASEAFDELEAVPWAQLARDELRAAGGRQRKAIDDDDELTAQEERAARAAGRGATTKEIAAELFLSPKTVEFHLGRAYRKLGVRSRVQLATALTERDQQASRQDEDSASVERSA